MTGVQSTICYCYCCVFQLASQASTNPLFPGYGIRKFNMQDMMPTTYQHVHKKSIRDMCFSQHDRSLLSVSLDCTAKLFDAQNNTVVQTFQGNYRPTKMVHESCHVNSSEKRDFRTHVVRFHSDFFYWLIPRKT